jgi:hypothetical protein
MRFGRRRGFANTDATIYSQWPERSISGGGSAWETETFQPDTVLTVIHRLPTV